MFNFSVWRSTTLKYDVFRKLFVDTVVSPISTFLLGCESEFQLVCSCFCLPAFHFPRWVVNFPIPQRLLCHTLPLYQLNTQQLSRLFAQTELRYDVRFQCYLYDLNFNLKSGVIQQELPYRIQSREMLHY